ncbi:hypothetical protein [Actinomadura bangladeshensis]|uniref:Uncharacterized protein n=1 Tax=Actinomadura bangladeshensis TaxID=453573 RepID=A0A6L9Q991_9ACTN|nr:hypothetical protein [Actinomadura bangladeshensis]NEA21608.1 hypothetical protein [Actinomadura bangladeshensis]NEA22568.1 hypothetical protein [Actinomadura bangladeshensis]
MTTSPYLTLCSEQVQDLPEGPRAELIGWLEDAAPNPDLVYRVTFDAQAGGAAPLYVTELESDSSSPVLARVLVIPTAEALQVPDHLREHFEPCDSFL